jgi:hypothetical protein
LISQIASIQGLKKDEFWQMTDTARFLFAINNDERGDKEDRIQIGIALLTQLVAIPAIQEQAAL